MKKSLSVWSINFFGAGLALISSLFVVRLLVDSSFRMLYSFVPQIAAGLEVSITVFGWLLMVRSSSALLSPVLGVLADRYGRRNVMIFALVSQVFGMLGIAFFKGWTLVFCNRVISRSDSKPIPTTIWICGSG